MAMKVPDVEVVAWSQVRPLLGPRPVLLLGNGASQQMAAAFNYGNLSDVIQDPVIAALFNAHGTRNFEEVLAALRSCASTLRALGRSNRPAADAYSRVRQTFLEAMLLVHPRFGGIPLVAMQRYAQALIGHRAVFTTNYDLILPWTLMQGVTGRVRDFFWTAIGKGPHSDLRCAFTAADVSVTGDLVPIYYLHGAVHLYEPYQNIVAKRTADAGDLLGQALKAGLLPLLVSEGESKLKLARIAANTYLWFCYQALQTADGDVVVFGHSLSEQDQHVVDALAMRPRTLAISINTRTKAGRRERMRRYQARLPNHDLVFFDARTHPLGQLTEP